MVRGIIIICMEYVNIIIISRNIFPKENGENALKSYFFNFCLNFWKIIRKIEYKNKIWSKLDFY